MVLNTIEDAIKSSFNTFIQVEKKEIKYTQKFLESEIDKFFKREKKFKKNWLSLYYGFNKNISEVISVPYYISMFYSNVKYITDSVTNSDWDRIMKIYRQIVKKNPNYKNSRLDEEKPIYDRRYILLITYYIFMIFVYIIGHIFYSKLTQVFSWIENVLEIKDEENATFILFVAYILFIVGMYYGGISFIILMCKMLIKLIYYAAIFLYYFIYYLGWLLFIIFKLIGKMMYKAQSSMTGGGRKQISGGDIYEDLEEYINNIKSAFDKLSVELIVSIFDKFFNSIVPEENPLDTQCNSTSNIEKMLARNNSRRNTEEPVNINDKITDTVKTFIPSNIRNNAFVKCMIKKEPKPPPPPPKCDD